MDKEKIVAIVKEELAILQQKLPGAFVKRVRRRLGTASLSQEETQNLFNIIQEVMGGKDETVK